LQVNILREARPHSGLGMGEPTPAPRVTRTHLDSARNEQTDQNVNRHCASPIRGVDMDASHKPKHDWRKDKPRTPIEQREAQRHAPTHLVDSDHLRSKKSDQSDPNGAQQCPLNPRRSQKIPRRRVRSDDCGRHGRRLVVTTPLHLPSLEPYFYL
jgi:hypothetical protein